MHYLTCLVRLSTPAQRLYAPAQALRNFSTLALPAHLTLHTSGQQIIPKVAASTKATTVVFPPCASSCKVPTTTDNDHTALEVLDLSHNAMTGTIPESLGFLPNLQQVLLQDNGLSGPLPESFVSNLTVFNVTNNALLSGTVPTFLCELVNASTLLGFDCTELLCGCNRCGDVCQTSE